jgi:hypothetical protein
MISPYTSSEAVVRLAAHAHGPAVTIAAQPVDLNSGRRRPGRAVDGLHLGVLRTRCAMLVAPMLRFR